MAKGQIKQKQALIKKEQFEKLCEIQCTEEEITSVFDVCSDTLCAWCKNTYGMNFSEVYKIKRQGGKASLRRNQFELAKTNASMSIWLGKQYLGQKDNIDVAVTTNEDDDLTKAIKEAIGRND